MCNFFPHFLYILLYKSSVAEGDEVMLLDLEHT